MISLLIVTMESRNELYVYLSSKGNSIKFSSNKNTWFTYIIKPKLSLQDKFDVALENIIFEPKIISIEKEDKNYGLELAAYFTNKDGIFHDGYNITYMPQIYIHGDTLEKSI